MTTDEKDKTPIEKEPIEEPAKTSEVQPEPAVTQKPEMTPAEKALVDRMTEIFENKLTETVDKYDKKIDDLKKSVDEKDREIAKLRKVNSEILMSTDLSGKNKEITDFNDVEFDEVDWGAQVKLTLDKIDKRIS